MHLPVHSVTGTVVLHIFCCRCNIALHRSIGVHPGVLTVTKFDVYSQNWYCHSNRSTETIALLKILQLGSSVTALSTAALQLLPHIHLSLRNQCDGG